MACTWDDLAGTTLARQFPLAPPPLADVAALVARTGPMQTQTARAAFVGLAARSPGVTHAHVTAAYTAGDLVRGSTIRGTVHTARPEQFAALGVGARLGLRRMWPGQLTMADERVESLWAATEDFAVDWRTPAELQDHVADWLATHEGATAAARAREHPGKFLALAHGGLVRRPASGDRWEGQGRPLYRRFTPVGAPGPTDLVRLHLTSHGPASRHDIAWWSGLTLTVVDAALADLELVEETGPDGRSYLDLPTGAAPRELSGVRLLPEFDALLCAYDSRRRDRFVTPEHHAALWSRANGMILPPLLVDGRISGFWRATGSARRRPLAVHWFAGTRRPRQAEVDVAVASLEAALDITVTEVSLTRTSP